MMKKLIENIIEIIGVTFLGLLFLIGCITFGYFCGYGIAFIIKLITN